MERRALMSAAAAAGVLAVAVAVTIGVSVRGDGESRERPATTPSPSRTTPATATPSPGPQAQRSRPSSRWLLPNMRSLRARDVQITGSGADRRLRFASWLANEGPGPLLLRPRPARECRPQQRGADQILHADDNGDERFQRGRDPRGRSFPVGCMVDHPTHDHWHFDAMARYTLTDLTGSRVAGRDKVSFCLRDNRRVPGPTPAQPKEHFGECERNTVQGISPGWVDIYDVDTPGQWIRLPRGLSDGDYCLVQEADPHDLLLETDENDNATPLVVRITGSRVSLPGTRACAGTAS